ncbi:MAG: hypothetical protein RLZZ611_1310 [Cyanobacteriota bacterium]
MAWRRVQAGMRGKRARGRSDQPRFHGIEVVASWLGACVGLLGIGPWVMALPVGARSPLRCLQSRAAPYPGHWL